MSVGVVSTREPSRRLSGVRLHHERRRGLDKRSESTDLQSTTAWKAIYETSHKMLSYKMLDRFCAGDEWQVARVELIGPRTRWIAICERVRVVVSIFDK